MFREVDMAPRGKKKNAVLRRNLAKAVKPKKALVAAPADPTQASIIQLFGKLVDPSGQPAAGVGISLGFKLQKTNIANTVSDSNGAFVLTYLSTSVSALTEGDAPVLFLSVNANPVALVTANGTLDLNALGSPGSTRIYGPIHIVTEKSPPPGLKSVAPRARLLGGSATMLEVLKRAPGIFTRPVSANAGGCCGPASPSDMATRVYYINQFAMFDEPWASAAPAPPQDPKRIPPAIPPVNIVTSQTAAPQTFRWGAMITFQQEWWDLGFSLGDLLYSIPLAPGEETNIATVDWRRQDYAKRNTTLDESSFQDTTISRDQAIDEVVNMNSDKHVCDGTVGGGLGISYGCLSIGASGQYSEMHGTSAASSQAQTNINDRIHQASITTRQTKAYSVVETTQQEQATVSTRVIRNHNHCHTITFQYFEVLRQFRISTQAIDVRPVLFVPFLPTPFTTNEVLNYGYILRRGLIDTTLQPVLDEYLGVTTPAQQPSSGSGTTAASGTSYTTFLVTAYASVQGGNVDISPAGLGLVIDDDLQTISMPSAATVTNLSAGKIYSIQLTYSFTNAKQFPGIQKIGLQNLPTSVGTPGKLFLDILEISAVDSSGSTQLVYFSRGVEIDPERTFVDLITNSGTATQSSSTQGPDLTRLLGHLNANSAYYTNLIVAAGDAATRYSILESHYNVAHIVDNTVIGTIGNYIGFPSSMAFLPPKYQGPGPIELPPPEERLITLPTPGVFAESQMGSCSACEVIDETTFWDWQKSPTPENAPDISAAMLASRFQDLSSLTLPTQSTLQPPPVVVPSEPTPPITVGDATMANLVKDLNLTDPSSVLSLVNGLVSASAQGYKNMVNANQGSPGMSSGGGDGTSDGTGNGTGAGGDGANLTASDTAVV